MYWREWRLRRTRRWDRVLYRYYLNADTNTNADADAHAGGDTERGHRDRTRGDAGLLR
jgi:hypothetical protein